MTGPEHYAKAEVYLKDARGSELGSEVEQYSLAAAQVHATLALAAATATNGYSPNGMNLDNWEAWAGVSGVRA